MSAFANFQALVMNLWQGSIASSFFHRYESNNSAIDAMSTESGKSLATKAFIGKDQTDFSFFFDLVIPTITEFIGVAACGTYDFLSGTGTSATQVTRFSLRNSSKLFSGIPNGAGKLLGQRGEDLTELMLRRAYPNAIIAKQVTFKMGKYLKSDCDFIVINEGKVVAIWESKVNGAIMSKGQEALYLEKQTGVFTGKAAEQYGLSGQGLPAGVGLKEIRYNSTTGAATIFNH